MTTVRIREIYKLIPLPGEHTGHDHGPTTGYEIVGPWGVVDKARTQASADRKRAEWQDYYNRLDQQGENHG